VVNNWNEMHSPAKPLVSPRKQNLVKQLEALEIRSDSDSPTTSPRKKSASPTKQSLPEPSTSQLRAERKAFAAVKHKLAEAFLSELDNTITSGRISTMCAPTGGIKLVWSKTLKTTAGRANWRREQIRTRSGPLPTDITTTHLHHCSIELAEKVIDDADRLRNVLAHEFCHLAVFLIDGIRNNPHGKEFKSWAKKVGDRFGERGVEVTTKHSYEIEYRYVWECVVCGYLFKRHSRSVDPKRHSCGKCRGRLLQVKPTPRGGGAAAAGAAGAAGEKGKARSEGKSEYQVFVKENFARVKSRLAEKGAPAGLGDVMKVLGEEYKAWKVYKAGLREEEERENRENRENRERIGAAVEEMFEALRIEDRDA
jgi:predicted SprT family Zn-dependent metalloprotease